MEYNINIACFKNMLELFSVTHGGYLNFKGQIRAVFSDKFLLYFIGIVFVNVKYDKMTGIQPCNLTTKLRTDRTASACNKNCLPDDIFTVFFGIKHNRLTAKEVFHLYLTNRRSDWHA